MSYTKTPKKYVLMISKTFPATHRRAGENTEFAHQIEIGMKIHTIRKNYYLWEHRMKKILAGEAELHLRQWEGKPYKSKQMPLKVLTAQDGIGIEELVFDDDGYPFIRQFPKDGLFANDYDPIEPFELVWNDGLTKEDWDEWFKNCNKEESMVIIHFTDFRYLKR